MGGRISGLATGVISRLAVVALLSTYVACGGGSEAEDDAGSGGSKAGSGGSSTAKGGSGGRAGGGVAGSTGVAGSVAGSSGGNGVLHSLMDA